MADLPIPQNDELPEVPSLDHLMRLADVHAGAVDEGTADQIEHHTKRLRSALSGLLARLRELSEQLAAHRDVATDWLAAQHQADRMEAERDALSVRLRQAELDRDEARRIAEENRDGARWLLPWEAPLPNVVGEVGEALAPHAAAEKPDDTRRDQ